MLSHWVFGGIERNFGRCFLVEVPDRTVETHRAAIERWILPGSHVVSDGWASYGNIDRCTNNIYTHEVVVYHENFVNLNNPDVHTQNIENLSHLLLCVRAKKNFADKVVQVKPCLRVICMNLFGEIRSQTRI